MTDSDNKSTQTQEQKDQNPTENTQTFASTDLKPEQEKETLIDDVSTKFDSFFTENVSPRIKTPAITKLLSAIISGLGVGLVIWLLMSIIAQQANPPVPAWITGIILLQIADAWLNFTSKIQSVVVKLLRENIK